MIDTVLFDFDGTLMDTTDVIVGSWQHTFVTLTGREGDLERIYRTFGEILRDSMVKMFPDNDPRAIVMRDTCHEVLDALHKDDNPLLAVATELEKIALSDEYFIERNLYPNVDFYSGIILNAIGIPTSMFTVIFAIARTIGWISHWNEMRQTADSRLGRPRQIYTGKELRNVKSMSRR